MKLVCSVLRSVIFWFYKFSWTLVSSSSSSNLYILNFLIVIESFILATFMNFYTQFSFNQVFIPKTQCDWVYLGDFSQFSLWQQRGPTSFGFFTSFLALLTSQNSVRWDNISQQGILGTSHSPMLTLSLIKNPDFVEYAIIIFRRLNFRRLNFTGMHHIYTILWRPCNFTPTHSLTGPVSQPFASRLGGQRFAYLGCTHSHTGTRFLLLVLSRYHSWASLNQNLRPLNVNREQLFKT